jgi:hypothetical protein
MGRNCSGYRNKPWRAGFPWSLRITTEENKLTLDNCE